MGLLLAWQGEALFEYVLWHSSLTEGERAQWATRLAGLPVGDGRGAALARSRLQGRLEADRSRMAPAVLERGAELLLEALGND